MYTSAAEDIISINIENWIIIIISLQLLPRRIAMVAFLFVRSPRKKNSLNIYGIE